MRSTTCRLVLSLDLATVITFDFQAQKGFLHAQLENSLTVNNKLDSEVTGLKYELRNKETENQDLRNRVLRLEV